MPTSRRLAAIMFADIAGYTAMMQRNEQEGLAKVRRFSEVVEQQVSEYQGEVVQFMGDGCLCVFHSAVQAMHAAKHIQQALQSEPQVPLRIGIHIGDIVRQEGNIYGDGVNLASRVESMGVPGSILVTERVIHDVKSHPEFKMASLGRFQFKHVEKPMEVFALANEGFVVPKQEEMKGKGDHLGRSRKWIMQLVSVGIFTMVLGASLFWIAGNQLSDQSQLLSQDIREAKVAVSVFDNFSGDENLDALGYMASEWVSSGLRELKVRTVSPEMVRQNKDAIGILPDNPQKKASFAEITGAEYVVTGSYFLQEDSIILHTRLSSTRTGEEVQTFPQLKMRQSEKEALVEEVRQHLLGYWVSTRDQKLPTVTPPTYAAYQKYLTCAPNMAHCHQEVVELDPNFILARIGWMTALTVGLENDSAYYANKLFIEERWDQCTEFEKHFFQMIVATWEGNYTENLTAAKELYSLDSNNIYGIQSLAFVASVHTNRPYEAIKAYDKVFQNLDLYGGNVHRHHFTHYSEALNKAGFHDQLIDLYSRLSPKYKEVAGDQLLFQVMISLAKKGRTEEIETLIQETTHTKEAYLRAAYIYEYLHPDSTYNPFVEGLNARIGDFSADPPFSWSAGSQFYHWQSKAMAHYVLKEWDLAEQSLMQQKELLSLEIQQPYIGFPEQDYWYKLWHTGMLGCVYARQQKIDKTKLQLQKLEELGQMNTYTHGIFHRGTIPYLKARIYAILGDQNKATDLLKSALEQGRVFGYWSYHFDLDFVSLLGYEPFDALIRPKG